MIRCALAETLQPAHVDAARAQAVDLGGQHLRVDDDAVADDAGLARVEDPARDQVELPGLAVAHDRVPGVVAALEADDRVGPLGEQVDDLALALIAPLGANDADAWHSPKSLTAGPLRQSAGPARCDARWSLPKIGSSSHISSSRDTVRGLICSASASRSRLVVTNDRSLSS